MSIEAMKLALEALEFYYDQHGEEKDGQAITALRQAIEQAQQAEPVAYDKTELNRFAQDLYDQKMREGKHGHYESMFHVIHQCIKRVAPPQRQPLTDDEIEELMDTYDVASIDYARAIEAAHGITGEQA